MFHNLTTPELPFRPRFGVAQQFALFQQQRHPRNRAYSEARDVRLRYNNYGTDLSEHAGADKLTPEMKAESFEVKDPRLRTLKSHCLLPRAGVSTAVSDDEGVAQIFKDQPDLCRSEMNPQEFDLRLNPRLNIRAGENGTTTARWRRQIAITIGMNMACLALLFFRLRWYTEFTLMFPRKRQISTREKPIQSLRQVAAALGQTNIAELCLRAELRRFDRRVQDVAQKSV